MSLSNMDLTLGNIRSITVMVIDIFVMWLILYYAIKVVKSNSRTIQIFKGVLLVIIVDFLAKFLGLTTLQYFVDIFINWGFLAVIIIFQPEIRSLLEKLGKTNMFSRITTLTGSEKENLVDQIVTATMLLSNDMTGALISIEQSHSLQDYVNTGIKMNSDVTAELLTSIFVTSTPLHDGAVIIQGNKLACASAYFPPTNIEIPSRYGARHRAAIGISEITDAVTIIVSEETGEISITEGGKLFHVNKRQLRNYLLRVICGIETEVDTGAAVEDNQRDIIIDDKKEEKEQNTGLINKLAIKKQGEEEKIEVEEVVVNEEANTNDKKAKPSHSFSPFKKANKEDKAMAKIEEEASEIKLPKKKERPLPSYPEQTVSHDIEPSIEVNEEEKQFDTSRIDISKIVGLNDELDRKLNIIDESKNDDREAGE